MPLIRSRLAAILTTLLLLTGLATAASAITARPASADVIFGPQCSELQDGHVIWIHGIRYTCTHTRWGWWYVAYWGGCGARPATAPARQARTC